MIISHTTNEFPETIPTSIDTYSFNHARDGEDVLVNLHDTKGADDYERLRGLSYVGADVFLLCFDLHSRESFETLKTWNDGVRPKANPMDQPRPTPKDPRHFTDDDVPVIIVGLKDDDYCRNQADKVSREEGHTLCRDFNAHKYMECSAMTQRGQKDVFSEAVQVGMKYLQSKLASKKKKKCVIC
ncbi:Ras-related GTPase Rac [Acrasis kona]|uniref:Ras-related GTPase Rac n=1 Tax=Acrasis kona TaxID=1008807 RepID=A0AAW2Z8B5_9EUKA